MSFWSFFKSGDKPLEDNGEVNTLTRANIKLKRGKLVCPFCLQEIQEGVSLLLEGVITCPNCNAKMQISSDELTAALGGNE
jgi:Zn finger protein HypA/HybF involved in hydrogenase expression